MAFIGRWLASSLIATTGCSALLVRTPEPTARPPLDCAGRYVAAGLDAAITLTGLIGFAYAFSKRDTTPSEHNHFDPYAFMLGPIAVPTMFFGFSALHGFTAADRCVEIDRAWAEHRPPPSQPPTPPPGIELVPK